MDTVVSDKFETRGSFESEGVTYTVQMPAGHNRAADEALIREAMASTRACLLATGSTGWLEAVPK